MNLYPLFLIGFVYILLFYLFTQPKTIKKNSFRDFLKVRFLKIGGIFESVSILLQLINPQLLRVSPTPIIMIQLLGLVFFIVGLSIITWAKITMGGNWALPGSVKDNQKSLITSGPFLFSRNPIYVGRILTLIGFELGLQSWLILILIPDIIATHFIIAEEERSLYKKFGKSYENYTNKVRRYL